MQNKFQSLIESFTIVISGFFVALAVQLLIFPLYDIEITLFQNVQIVMILTVTSIIRVYIVRRLFNRIRV
jgi:hypothetical protein